ncbi:hypothetical protein D3C87_1203350 [compost metagenome]
MIKTRYYILAAFYIFCFLTFKVAVGVKHALYRSMKFDTLSDNLDFVIYGFFQTVAILILIWLLVGCGGYLYGKRQLQKKRPDSKISAKEIVQGFKLSLFSVLTAALLFLVMIVFKI